MAVSHLPFLLIRPRLTAPSRLHIFIPPLSSDQYSHKCYRPLSTESSPSPHDRDNGPLPGFNAAAPKDLNSPSNVSPASSNSGQSIPLSESGTHCQHWHALNLNQHRDHYSGLGSLGSYVVSQIQEKWGAGRPPKSPSCEPSESSFSSPRGTAFITTEIYRTAAV
ncbi:histidinol-phosphate aminotransferase [Histoplasma capsulatum]|uniref:Histidinol-phosphate aminotransferase n=1 Tax=Ajellomyces capsulatus TaxID=5037 RepID=A0A8A1M2C5_AJECA|nr:histidinol-phosphate aminotransferase [Histoplasma capsulatum]